MKKIWLLFVVVCIIPRSAYPQSSDEKAILKILDDQTKMWNRGDLNNFMKGYWKNDSLMFIGKSGVTYGYQNTLNNYKESYGDTVQMGKLSFDIIKVRRLSPEFYFVVGKWFLHRSIGDLSGHYTLLFRKIKGQWVIVADHSS